MTNIRKHDVNSYWLAPTEANRSIARLNDPLDLHSDPENRRNKGQSHYVDRILVVLGPPMNRRCQRTG